MVPAQREAEPGAAQFLAIQFLAIQFLAMPSEVSNRRLAATSLARLAAKPALSAK
jgi:hypothetical protein